MTETVTVMLVGHCGPDSHLLAHAVRSAVPNAKVVNNTDEKDLWETGADLLLVNRVLDGWYEDGRGLRLVEAAASRGVPVMLISNYADAQAAAEAAGACPGFGKSEARSEKATRAVRAALESTRKRDTNADA